MIEEDNFNHCCNAKRNDVGLVVKRFFVELVDGGAVFNVTFDIAESNRFVFSPYAGCKYATRHSWWETEKYCWQKSNCKPSGSCSERTVLFEKNSCFLLLQFARSLSRSNRELTVQFLA